MHTYMSLASTASALWTSNMSYRALVKATAAQGQEPWPSLGEKAEAIRTGRV